MSCMRTVYIEATNGVGAPIGYWNNVSSHGGRAGSGSSSGPGSGGVTSDSVSMQVNQ